MCKARTHHRRDRASEGRRIVGWQASKVPFQQKHVVREQLASWRIQGSSPCGIQDRHDSLETVAREEKNDALVLHPRAVSFLRQRYDERYSRGHRQRGVTVPEFGPTARAQNDGPMVHRIAAYEGSCPVE